MFGNITVNEMALSGQRDLRNDSSGLKGYDPNAEIRFNFVNKKFYDPKGKMKR